MKSDIEIANLAKIKPIAQIASKLGLNNTQIIPYGYDKCKINLWEIDPERKPNNKLILVTAINPTPLGEGKTTVSIGLADGFSRLGESVNLALRQPSLGPVFGVKGGATGGGYAQIAPMTDINLHFTGDFHAITSANNLLAALLDNSIYQGNPLGIDPTKISFKRCLDLNDRQLREIEDGLGTLQSGLPQGTPRIDGFDITAASEIMAVFCLAKNLQDLKKRLGEIVVAENFAGEFVKVSDLGIEGSLAVLLKDAFNPNLVQTLEGTPAIIHGGPFANIAHGCNSIVATNAARATADWTITEAGFGADLGAEKFFDIKCRANQIEPAATVIVATIRSLKYNGNGDLRLGSANLERHIENLRKIFNQKVIVAINKFADDPSEDIQFLENFAKGLGANVAVFEGFEFGGAGGENLAKEIIAACQSQTPSSQSSDGQFQKLTFPYDENDTVLGKIEKIAQKIYKAGSVILSPKAKEQIVKIQNSPYSEFPICIAKTQYSFSDDAQKLGAPSDFDFQVRELRVSAGAKFIVVICGNILTMPGLPKEPAANNIDLDENNQIIGIF